MLFIYTFISVEKIVEVLVVFIGNLYYNSQEKNMGTLIDGKFYKIKIGGDIQRTNQSLTNNGRVKVLPGFVGFSMEFNRIFTEPIRGIS